jgi:hypothetical protein
MNIIDRHSRIPDIVSRVAEDYTSPEGMYRAGDRSTKRALVSQAIGLGIAGFGAAVILRNGRENTGLTALAVEQVFDLRLELA